MTRSLVAQAFGLYIMAAYCMVIVRAGPLDSPKTIAHDNGAVRYSSIAGGLGKGECNRVPSPCTNKWWTQNNEGGNANQFRTTHTTAGPSAGMSFSFYGSRAVAILGKRDSSAVPTVTLNGRSYGLTGQQEPVLFSTEALDPNVSYTLEMRYTGGGFLNVAALYLDQNGMVGTRPRDPDPTPDPTPDPKQTDPVISPTPPTTDQQKAPPTDSPPTSTTTTTRSEPDQPGQVDSPDQPTSSRTSPPDTSGPGGETHSDDGEAGPSATDSADADAPANTTGSDNMNSPGLGVLSPTQGSSATPGLPSGSGKKKPNAGALAAVIVGGVLLLLLLLLLGVWYLHRRMHARRAPSYAFRQGRIPWLLGNSSERVPDAWERFGAVGGGGGASGTGNRAGTSRKNVTGHESFQAGMPSPGLPPSMDERSVRSLTWATTRESWDGRVV